jgi:hypothetical protein
MSKKLSTYLGTCHFVSFEHACQYYAMQRIDADEIKAKLDSGEIKMGPPKISRTQELILIDNATRYAIQSRTEPLSARTRTKQWQKAQNAIGRCQNHSKEPIDKTRSKVLCKKCLDRSSGRYRTRHRNVWEKLADPAPCSLTLKNKTVLKAALSKHGLHITGKGIQSTTDVIAEASASIANLHLFPGS